MRYLKDYWGVSSLKDSNNGNIKNDPDQADMCEIIRSIIKNVMGININYS